MNNDNEDNTLNEQIVKLIEQQLNNLVFNEGITDQSTFDKNLNNQIKTKLSNSFVDEKIIAEEIWVEAFETILSASPKGEYKTQKKLSEFSKINITDLARNICQYLQKLPEKYEFIFPLPKSEKEIPLIKLTDNVELLTLNDIEYKKYHEDTEQAYRKSLATLIINKEQPVFSKGTVVLRISGIGYVSKFGLIRIVNIEDPSYIFKAVLGTFIATGMLTRNKNIAFFPFKSEYRYSIYRLGEKEELRTISQSTDDSDYIFRMDFDISKHEQSSTDKLLKSPPQFLRTCDLLGNILTRIKIKGRDIISANQQSVKNGAFWLYEAIKTSEEHNRTIYATTAFDALVGSRSLNEEGKGRDRDKEYKADLISQSIGRNIYETDFIKKQIVELYNNRNKIVHGERPIYSTEKYDDDSGTTMMCTNFLLRYFTNKLYFIGQSIPKVVKK